MGTAEVAGVRSHPSLCPAVVDILAGSDTQYRKDDDG